MQDFMVWNMKAVSTVSAVVYFCSRCHSFSSCLFFSAHCGQWWCIVFPMKHLSGTYYCNDREPFILKVLLSESLLCCKLIFINHHFLIKSKGKYVFWKPVPYSTMQFLTWPSYYCSRRYKRVSWVWGVIPALGLNAETWQCTRTAGSDHISSPQLQLRALKGQPEEHLPCPLEQEGRQGGVQPEEGAMLLPIRCWRKPW